MAAAAWVTERALTGWLCLHALWLPTGAAQIVGCGTAVAVGAAVYFGIAKALKYPELGFVTEALASRRKKKSAGAAE